MTDLRVARALGLQYRAQCLVNRCVGSRAADGNSTALVIATRYVHAHVVRNMPAGSQVRGDLSGRMTAGCGIVAWCQAWGSLHKRGQELPSPPGEAPSRYLLPAPCVCVCVYVRMCACVWVCVWVFVPPPPSSSLTHARTRIHTHTHIHTKKHT